jgi:hypothetical protein
LRWVFTLLTRLQARNQIISPLLGGILPPCEKKGAPAGGAGHWHRCCHIIGTAVVTRDFRPVRSAAQSTMSFQNGVDRRVLVIIDPFASYLAQGSARTRIRRDR